MTMQTTKVLEKNAKRGGGSIMFIVHNLKDRTVSWTGSTWCLFRDYIVNCDHRVGNFLISLRTCMMICISAHAAELPGHRVLLG